jgi:hypothetical protein
LLESFIKEDNDNNELKIMYGYESRPEGKEFIKPILVIKNKWFLPVRIFEKNGIEYYKVLSVLYDTQYFSSINLNFGLHTELKPIRFNIIEVGETFFDNTYNYIDITKPFEDFNWKLEKTSDEKVDKIINISNKIQNRTNKVLEKEQLPFKIKTFRGKVIELV